MKIEYLREFIVLAEVCNYFEAAERLYISQSTLSKHISSIEQELGVPLFDRTTRKVVLNKNGELFLPYCRQIIDLQNAYREALLKSEKTEKKKISIASFPMMDTYGIIPLINSFRDQNRSIDVQLIEAFDSDPLSFLDENKCQFAFVREEKISDKKYERLRFASDILVAVLPTDHKYADRKTITLDLLKDEPFLFAQKKTRLYEHSLNACHKAGFEPNIIFMSHHLENIVSFVKQNMGISLMMKKQAENFMDDSITSVEIYPTETSYINVCYERKWQKDPTCQSFVNYIHSYLLSNYF